MRPITLTSTVNDARRALAATDQPALVVWDDAMPVGVVTVDDVSGPRAPSSEALIEDVLSHECVAVDPAADVRETKRRFTDAAWLSLKRRRPLSDGTLERRARPPGTGD